MVPGEEKRGLCEELQVRCCTEEVSAGRDAEAPRLGEARAPSKRHQEATRLSGSTALRDALEDLPSTFMNSTYSRDQTNGACFNTAFARFDVSSQGLAVMRAMYGYVRDRNGWRTPCPIGPLMQHVYDSVDGAIPDDIAEAVMVLDEVEALISSNQENCVEFQHCMVPKATVGGTSAACAKREEERAAEHAEHVSLWGWLE